MCWNEFQSFFFMCDETIKYKRLIKINVTRAKSGKIMPIKIMISFVMSLCLNSLFMIKPNMKFSIKFIASVNASIEEINVMISIPYNNLGVMKMINKLMMNNESKSNKYAMMHNCTMRNMSEC